MFEEDENEVETEVSEKPEKPEKEDLTQRYYSVTLPSNGKLGYPGEIEYRDILVRDEKILSTATGKNYQKVLNGILKSLLKDDSLFDNLTIYDRDFLLLWIWANNYSTKREFEVSCPNCGNKDDISIDLTKDVDIIELAEDYEDPFVLDLSNGDHVKVRFLTIKDEVIAEEFVSKNNKYDLHYVKLALSVDLGKIMRLPEKISYIEEHFTGRDMGMVRAFHSYFKYGIDDDVEHTCSACGEVTRHEIPFSVEFFLPTLRSDFKEMLHSNKRTKHKSNRRGSNANSRGKRVS